MIDYVEALWDQSQDPEHPPMESDNWRLTEKWFSIHEGQHKTKSTNVVEKMQRTADSLPAGLSLMNMEEEAKSKQKPVQDRHKLSLVKLQGVLNKLGKNLSPAESSLPSLKRKLMEKGYTKVKGGLNGVRESKAWVLDQLEDLKHCPSVEAETEEMVTKMAKLQKDVQHN